MNDDIEAKLAKVEEIEEKYKAMAELAGAICNNFEYLSLVANLLIDSIEKVQNDIYILMSSYKERTLQRKETVKY